MKLTAIILLAGFLQLSARSTAQQRISLTLKNASLDKIFAEIEKRSGYTVFYNVEVLKYTAPITIDMKDATIDDVLHFCLKGLPLEYTIQDKTIFIKRGNRRLASDLPPGDPGPPTTVTGLVHTEAGIPLAGASVYISKLKKSTLTNEQGQFTFKDLPDGSYDVDISYVGFEPLRARMAVSNHTGTLAAALKQSTSKLDETQVIAYGSTSQRLSTGDVTVVTAKEIEAQPVANPLSALEGRVPGLAIAQTSGIPGGAFTVQIRGQNSLLNGNDPFYVVDGVPYSSQTVNIINNNLAGNNNLYGNTGFAGSPFNYLNPADIESISILKDADATSIYGSRAANGAILITTKKGKPGDSRVNINLCSGFGEVAKMMHLLNTAQYLQMRHEALNNDGAAPSPNSDYDLTFWDTTRYTDWQKAFIGNKSHYDDAQVSALGGNENIQYLLGGGYHRETTVFPETFADEKASTHFNFNSSSLNKKFKVSATASYTADMSDVPTTDLTYLAMSLPPDAPPVRNPNGTLNWAPLTPGQSGTWYNPLSPLLNAYKGRTNNLVSNALLSYNLIPGLTLSTSLGYTRTQTNETIINPASANDPGYHITTGQTQFNTSSTSSWIVEPQINYAIELGKGVLKALVGTTFEENTVDDQNLYGSGISSDALLLDIQASTNVYVLSAINSDYKYNAFFGRLNYNWQDKYLINLTARRDGSSRFGPGRQFADFGSIGGAWIFSKETFIQNSLPFLSFGKLRASYGTSGNDQIGDYRFIDLYTPSIYPYQNTQGLYPANLFNPNLAWELNKKFEGGVMLGFLKDRITAEASFYNNRSGNQLISEPLSSVTGFHSIGANLAAVVQNSGIELTLNSVNIKSRNFHWTSSFNLTAPKNKLISYPNLATSSYANRWVVGQPISIQKVYQLAGVNDSAGVYQFASAKGSTTFNPEYPNDLTAIVNPAPTLYGGFGNNFGYKGFQLDILIQFVRQTGENLFYNIQAPGFKDNQPIEVLNRWQSPGDIKPYQQFTENYGSNAYNAFGNYYTSSNAVYGDASYIRLKNVSLSYTLQTEVLRKMHLKNLRFYVNGQNLWTKTKYFGYDPETQGVKLPPLRAVVAGIEIGL